MTTFLDRDVVLSQREQVTSLVRTGTMACRLLGLAALIPAGLVLVVAVRRSDWTLACATGAIVFILIFQRLALSYIDRRVAGALCLP